MILFNNDFWLFKFLEFYPSKFFWKYIHHENYSDKKSDNENFIVKSKDN